MKKLICASVLALSVGFAGNAFAAAYSFEDMIDTWNGLDAVYISNGSPLSYTHDLNQEVNFSGGDTVTEAYLELDFTNDWSDGKKLWGLVQYDNREYVTVGFNGLTWVEIGEQDNGQYVIVLNIDWLNDDGLLDVTISVDNQLDTADAWLDHSRLYGTAETAPVPEPTTMLLFGTGLMGLATVGRRKKA